MITFRTTLQHLTLNGILNQEKNPEKSICQLKYIFIASSEFKTDLRFKNLEGAQVSIK